jgi:hypothetical protein
MPIKKIYSYLVPPGKHLEELPQLSGTEITLEGRLFRMLSDIYDKADAECNIPIVFLPAVDGAQKNECRHDLVSLLRRNAQSTAVLFANRLMKATTHKSGLGLLFIIIGKENDKYKCVISRFPADEGVMAEEDRSQLSVTFIERVFMKNAHAYKSALYIGVSFDSDFWEGNAVDRQISQNARELSQYWIGNFLCSDFKTTPKAGTKRLALALRTAINDTADITIKQEIVSSAVLAKNIHHASTSISDFCSRFHLSEAAKSNIVSAVGNQELADARFLFDVEEFQRFALYKAVELDNGGTMIAATQEFENCFNSEIINKIENKVRFTTEGKIINTRLRSKN